MSQVRRRRPPKRIAEYVGTNVRTQRNLLNMTLAQVADRVTGLGHQMSIGQLSEIETGRRNVTVDDLAALAQALHSNPNALMAPPVVAEDWDVLEAMNNLWDNVAALRSLATQLAYTQDKEMSAADAVKTNDVAGDPVLLFVNYAMQHRAYIEMRDAERMHDLLRSALNAEYDEIPILRCAVVHKLKTRGDTEDES